MTKRRRTRGVEGILKSKRNAIPRFTPRQQATLTKEFRRLANEQHSRTLAAISEQLVQPTLRELRKARKSLKAEGFQEISKINKQSSESYTASLHAHRPRRGREFKWPLEVPIGYRGTWYLKPPYQNGSPVPERWTETKDKNGFGGFSTSAALAVPNEGILSVGAAVGGESYPARYRDRFGEYNAALADISHFMTFPAPLADNTRVEVEVRAEIGSP